MLRSVTVARRNSSQGTVTKVAQGGRQIPHPVSMMSSVHTTLMNNLHCPFLTNTQWEELETNGMITMTDEILDALFTWANDYDSQQDDSQQDS